MLYLIDGYNLLNHAPICSPGVRVTAQRTIGEFETARYALLDFLVLHLWDNERNRTTVVFDAANAPPGLPRRVNYQGITVYYASEFPTADAMIEQLVQKHTAPRTLTVVSSDHAVQRSARRRRAKAIDSERWYQEMIRRRRDLLDLQRALPDLQPGSTPEEHARKKPKTPLISSQVEQWLRYFGLSGKADQADNADADNEAVPMTELSDNVTSARISPQTNSPSLPKKRPAQSTAKPPAKPLTKPPAKSTPVKPDRRVNQPADQDELDKPRLLDEVFPPEYLAEVEQLLRKMDRFEQ